VSAQSTADLLSALQRRLAEPGEERQAFRAFLNSCSPARKDEPAERPA